MSCDSLWLFPTYSNCTREQQMYICGHKSNKIHTSGIKSCKKNEYLKLPEKNLESSKIILCPNSTQRLHGYTLVSNVQPIETLKSINLSK